MPNVVVIGGGATGVGIARDAGLRGFKVTLIERGDLGSGTSTRFHGILHSGARYTVNDPEVAAACYHENQLLRHVIPTAITDTGGLFVALTVEEVAHADVLMAACARAGIPTTEITPEEAIAAEPHLSHAVRRAFRVPDGFVDGAEVLRLNRLSAMEADVPATFLPHHTVTGFKQHAGRLTAVMVADSHSGAARQVACDYVINAGGVWAGQIAALADIPLHMIFDKGTMITFKHQFSRAVLNRCRPENDGDLLVPGGPNGGSVMGTTARVITDPDACFPTQEEVDLLLKEGTALIPQLQHAEATRVFAGVRPLFNADSPALTPGADNAVLNNSRKVRRSFEVLDHSAQGVDNFLSVVGGKVTLYRLMAETTVDLLCDKAKVRAACPTASLPLRPASARDFLQISVNA